jgi:hypothetical protein
MSALQNQTSSYFHKIQNEFSHLKSICIFQFLRKHPRATLLHTHNYSSAIIVSQTLTSCISDTNPSIQFTQCFELLTQNLAKRQSTTVLCIQTHQLLSEYQHHDCSYHTISHHKTHHPRI